MVDPTDTPAEQPDEGYVAPSPAEGAEGDAGVPEGLPGDAGVPEEVNKEVRNSPVTDD